MCIVVRAFVRALRMILLALAGAFGSTRPVFLRHEDATAEIAEPAAPAELRRG